MMNRRTLLRFSTLLIGTLNPIAFASTHTHGRRQGHGMMLEPIPVGYRHVAQLAGIPAIVLYSVAIQESRMMFGDKAMPFPWTLNVAGTPRRFTSYQDTVDTLRSSVQRGISSVDCGLMQVNWRYHAQKLGNFYQALDPYPNLQVGAAILRSNLAVTGNWFDAIGRYHSPGDKQRADSYAMSVSKYMQQVPNA